MLGVHTVRDRVFNAISQTLRSPAVLDDELSFIADLGYDSLRVASLSMALESEFGQPVLLNDWLSSSDDPEQLTVGSLVAYLSELRGEGV
jgi:acyl carrier protein